MDITKLLRAKSLGGLFTGKTALMNLSYNKKDFGLFYYEKKYSHMIFFKIRLWKTCAQKEFSNHSLL